MGLYYPERENLPKDNEHKRAAELDQHEGVKPESPKGWPFESLYDEGEGTSAGIGGGDSFNLAKGPESLIQKAVDPVEALVNVERIPGSDDNLQPTIIEHDGVSKDILGDLPEEDDEAARWLRQFEEEKEEKAS